MSNFKQMSKFILKPFQSIERLENIGTWSRLLRALQNTQSLKFGFNLAFEL